MKPLPDRNGAKAIRLVLFDIDGTLLNPNGAGHQAVESVLYAVSGRSGDLRGLDFAGRTDLNILTDGLNLLGVPEAEIEPLVAAAIQRLTAEMESALVERPPTLLPGVVELLRNLAERGIALGLLTGNADKTATLKLRAAGIDPGEFVVGAFGHEAADRNDLGSIALHRFSAMTGSACRPEQVLIIGDTPADVRCGQVNGMRTAAVATGWTAYQELADTQPDYVFENFWDVATVIRTLFAEA